MSKSKKAAPRIPSGALTVSVHRQSFLECAGAKEGFAFLRIAGVFGLTPALTTTNDLVYVSAPHLEGLQLTHGEALQIAVEQAIQTLGESGANGGLIRWHGQGVESLLVVGPRIAQLVPIEGAPVVMVPAEGLALMAGADDDEALANMLDHALTAYTESEAFISLRAVTWTSDDPVAVEWLPPEGHPLRAHFKAAAAKTLKHEAESLHATYAAELAPLAHLAALDTHGGGLVGSWVRGADVVMPRVDRVVLFDTEDAGLPRVEVEFEALLKVCGDAFRPLPVHQEKRVSLKKASLFRLDGSRFPTATQRQWVKQPQKKARPKSSRAQPALLLSSETIRSVSKELSRKQGAVEKQAGQQILSTWEPARLFPAVRPPGYDEGKHANELGQVLAMAADAKRVVHSKPVSRPAAEGLRIDLVSDRGERMLALTTLLLTPELTEAAWRSALLNLEAASLQPFERTNDRLFTSPWLDGYDFARVLLFPRLLERCEVDGTPLVFAPTLSKVWVTGAGDKKGLTMVLDAIDDHFSSGAATSPYQYRELLFGWPWTVRDGALVRAKPPAAFAKRIATLDGALEARRVRSRKHVKDFSFAVTGR